jgi:hypothetical protein
MSILFREEAKLLLEAVPNEHRRPYFTSGTVAGNQC